MEKSRIKRINELARLSRERGLTEEEKAEQHVLRREYIDAMKNSLRTHLSSIKIVDKNDGR